MVIDVLSRFILDASQLPAALPQDAPWRIAGRVDDLVLELLGSLPPGFERISAEAAVHRLATVASSALMSGPGSRIDANAVTSPGTLLPPRSVVPRLGLVHQLGAGGNK